MVRVFSAGLAAALLIYGSVASAQSWSDPSSTGRQQGFEQHHRWDRSAMSGSTTDADRSYRSRRSADQFASEAEARRNCRSDTVVWANTKSHVYHFAGSPAYGNTKHGAYMCRADADRGFRAAKNESQMQRGDRNFLPQSGSSMNRY